MLIIIMSSNYFVNARRLQKKQLLEFIKQKQNTMSLNKILGIFSLRTGLKVSTLSVYVNELKMADLID